MIEGTGAGYDAYIDQPWTIPQGVDTTNPFHPFSGSAEAPEYLDLTGWTAHAQIRDQVGGDVWADFSSDATDGARITLADGWVTLVLPGSVTEAVAWNDFTKGVYDVELFDPDGHSSRLAKGKVTVKHDVTRNDS